MSHEIAARPSEFQVKRAAHFVASFSEDYLSDQRLLKRFTTEEMNIVETLQFSTYLSTRALERVCKIPRLARANRLLNAEKLAEGIAPFETHQQFVLRRSGSAEIYPLFCSRSM